VNWEHLKTFVWLRWRLAANHWRRGGALNGILTTIFVVAAIAIAIPLAIGCFILGLYLIPKAEPMHLMYAWDGLLLGFLFFWMIELITELQRTESLSLSKFMHLPVSLQGAFLINYVGSLLRFSIILFVPVMSGYALALVVSRGWTMLPSLLLLATFLLMITGVTYQFQGWLASLMSNPRRKRAVIVGITALFVLVMQLPNAINVMRPWRRGDQSRSSVLQEELAALTREQQEQQFDSIELLRRQNEIIARYQTAQQQATSDTMKTIADTTRLANTVLPIGWLPLGVAAAAEGNLLPATLGFLGMGGIGLASLWRAYQTTLEIYRGKFTAQSGRKEGIKAKPSVAETEQKARRLLVESRVPGLSEPVSAIALGGFRSLVRAPEGRMMLLTPLIFGVMFGSALVRGSEQIPVPFRPLIGLGGMGVVLFGLVQIMVNQFGFDRDGFRVFVLCAASRRDILLGKNLSFAPLALGLGALVLLAIQVLCPMRWDHLLAMLPQYVAMYLLFCPVANLISIYTPVPIAAGSLKPANPKFLQILMQALLVFSLFPLTLVPMLVPLGIEVLLDHLGWRFGLPVCLIVSLTELGVIVLLYRLCIAWEGTLLQKREKQILEAVTNRAA